MCVPLISAESTRRSERACGEITRSASTRSNERTRITCANLRLEIRARFRTPKITLVLGNKCRRVPIVGARTRNRFMQIFSSTCGGGKFIIVVEYCLRGHIFPSFHTPEEVLQRGRQDEIVEATQLFIRTQINATE